MSASGHWRTGSLPEVSGDYREQKGICQRRLLGDGVNPLIWDRSREEQERKLNGKCSCLTAVNSL